MHACSLVNSSEVFTLNTFLIRPHLAGRGHKTSVGLKNLNHCDRSQSSIFNEVLPNLVLLDSPDVSFN